METGKTNVVHSSAAVVGKLQRVPLRDVWKHEAHDFTTWLQENLDVVNNALDISLSGPEREAKRSENDSEVLNQP